MAELISHRHLFIAQPPLYRIKTSKDQQWVYSEPEKEEALRKLTEARKVEVQRYKGLGEMSAEQLWETTMNPTTRTLLTVSIEDAARADHIFSTLMGSEVPPAKPSSRPTPPASRTWIFNSPGGGGGVEPPPPVQPSPSPSG